MKMLSATTIAALSLLALPALTLPASAQQTPSTAAATGSTPAASPAEIGRMQQKITQDLQNDGYTEVHVIPDSFLVHAMNKRHEPVVMIINPNSIFEMTGAPGQRGQAHASTGNQAPATSSKP